MIYDYYKDRNTKRFKKTLLIVAAIIAFIIAAGIATNIYVQIIEYDEIGGLSGIYTRNLLYRFTAWLVSFIVIFFTFYVTGSIITKTVKNFSVAKGISTVKLPKLLPAAAAALIGSLASKEYIFFKALKYFNSTSFGKEDPVFGKDIGYYVFERPFLMSIYEFFSTLALFIIIFTVIYYLLALFRVQNNVTWHDLKDKSIIRHNLLNIAVYFVIKAFSYRFLKEGILYSEVVGVKGPGYVDVHLRLPFFTAAPFLLIAIVAASLLFLYSGKIKRAAFAIAVFPAVWILFSIAAGAYQSFIVNPNELNFEQKYLTYNMEKTREAYGFDRIEEHEFPKAVQLTSDVLERNSGTVERVRVVDYRSTLDTNIQLQAIRRFYTFSDGDIINYTVNGKDVPVFISARELDRSKLERSYLNLKYKYTHGYGIVMNPVNRIREGGQADFILSGLNMDTEDPALSVVQPRIYYGELTDNYVIVNAAGDLDEIDYDGYRNTRYNGESGIHLNLLNRFIYAFRYADMNILISNYAKGATLLPNRQVIERASKAVPFISVDSDPYILLTNDGRLKWVLDGYTTTDLYPCSQEYTGINYIRNSLKIIIDAYDGKVGYYVIDENDPLIKTYSRIYPDVFKFEELPEGITQHMRYPELLFEIQTRILRRYHLKPENVQEFYSNQDLWDISKYPANNNSTTLTDIDSYYNMISLPADISESEELILMRPFSPSNKHNMISWLAVRNAYQNYGEMILFNFPKNTNIFGPNQIEVKINQIDKISKDMALWGQIGSDVYKGSLLVIPIESSVLYVQPVYIRAAGTSSIPEIREIVVGFQWQDEFVFGIGTDFDDALNDLFSREKKEELTGDEDEGELGEEPGQKPVQTNAETVDQILKKYDEIKKQLEEMGRLIEQLN